MDSAQHSSHGASQDRSQQLQKDQAKLYSVGKEVGVKVDPDDPNVAVLWG